MKTCTDTFLKECTDREGMSLCFAIIKYTFSENSCFLNLCDKVTVSQSVLYILRSVKIPSINHI